MQQRIMQFMDTFADRLKFARTRSKLNQEELAELSGVGQGIISKLERGRIQKTTSMVALARALKCNPSWLETGIDAPGEVDGQKPKHGTVDATQGIHGLVPLIAWVQAGYGVSAVDNLHPGEGERIETTYRARRHTYALRVNGDSMEPKFPQGCIVIVEPEENPQHGKFVIVRQNGDEPTLKQYVEEGSNKYLKPLNPRYPIITMGPDDVFCGVVKRVEMDV